MPNLLFQRENLAAYATSARTNCEIRVELALEVRTREALPVQWEQTMSNLKIAKKALEDMK
jgi:hypothetical protein